LNAVYVTKQERDSRSEISSLRRQEIATALTGMFGTPDDPQIPTLGDLDVSSVLDIEKLKISAGPVASDESGRGLGLYREHCAHCHGVTGDGAGPTAAFLNPYPRDYRLGAFKFKSTGKGMRPTHADLRAILINGIAGTAMPSFKVLPENEIEALIDYVRYLSIRGEVERLLIGYVATELDTKEPLFTLSNEPSEAEKKTEQINLLKSFATEVVQKWVDAEGQAVEVPAPDPNRDMHRSIARGKELFYGAVANCVKCHGDSALGDGQTTDYDDWTKELEPANPDAVAAFLDAGALPPRNIRPRNLRQGVYRGGRRPIDLYWRLRNGIDGTPMPAVPLKPDDAGPEVKALTNADVWSIIDYVRSLPYESVSKPSMPEQTLGRTSL
jgi:mono/diheme cytochrome c family protein